jgi:valyl-tRNA synthetase
MHPTMPFISEALWTSLTGGESLVVSQWPSASRDTADADAEAVVNNMKRLITEIRRFRSDQGIKSSARVTAEIKGLSGKLADYEGAIRFLVRLDSPKEKFNPSAKIDIDAFVVEFDLTGSVDVKAERARLEKDLATVQKDRETARIKLDNENFMAKAPMDVVKEIRERLEFCDTEIDRIKTSLAALPKE